MKRRLPVIALSLLLAGHAWALDADAQKLADRYLTILQGNPAQQAVLDRLWKIYDDAGEAERLREVGRKLSGDHPILAAALLRRAGSEAEAGKILETAVEQGNPAAAEALAGRLTAKGDYAGAARLLEKAVTTKPSPGLLILLGATWHKAGDLPKARKAWEDALALSPNDLGLRQKLAQASVAAGDKNGAVAHWAVIAKHGSPSERFEAWQQIGRQEEMDGRLAEAIAAQESLLALMGSGHWQLEPARRRLLELHRRAGTLGNFGQSLRKEAEEQPQNAQSALRLADFYEFSGDAGERLTWLNQAAKILPADVGIARQVAALELEAGHPEKAAARYDRLLELRPGDPDLLFLRAEVAALSGDEAGAEKRVEEFLQAHPNDETAEGRAQEFYRRMRLSAPRERRLIARVSAQPKDESVVIELVRFYLGENRYPDAVAALKRHDTRGKSPAETAAAAFRFSQLLDEAHLRDDAVAWAKKASDGEPENADYALHLADLLDARDDRPGARLVLQRACDAADGLPREDLDRRLLLVIQAIVRGSPAGAPESVELEQAIDRLKTAARDPGARLSDWLRLARWLRWSSAQAQWVATLREAVKRHEHSRELREALATALVETGDTAGAIDELKRLVAQHPEEARENQRRIGHLELDRGNSEEGLKVFVTLASRYSQEWQAVADLALAEQVAGNWFKAMETWQRAYALALPEARPGIRQPLLNAASRLQLYDRGLDFLESAAVAERDAAAREDILREAAIFADQNHVGAAWHERLDKHLADAPGERFWARGKVFLLEAEGRKSEARAALIDSQRDEADSAESLEPLIRAAESAGDWAEAARLTRRVIGLSRQPDATRSIQLGHFLEQAGQWDQARNVWTAVASLYARDPAALTAAAEFFDRIGDEGKMESCYRGAARFGSCAPQVLLRLGGLALERGDRAQALADFEAVLPRARPDATTAKFCLPLPDLLMDSAGPQQIPIVAGGWRRPPGQPVPWARPLETDSQGCRLLAIRQAGRLLSNSPGKEAWLSQFTVPQEQIWALYSSGEVGRAFDEIEKLPIEPEAREAAWQAYAALLIENGDGKRLALWASGEPLRAEARWDMTAAALMRLLDAGWRPSAVETFASAPDTKRWQLAGTLASRNLYREACALGQSVPDKLPDSSGAGTSPASSAWLEFVLWKLALRDPEGAVEALDRAISSTPPSHAFGGPLLSAIRARWLLTPKDLRENYETSVTEKLRSSGRKDAETASAALFASLRGDPSVADQHLAALFAELGATRPEGWAELVQQGGLQLEDWNLPRLARELYRLQLSQDRALQVMRGQDFQVPTENLLIANQLTWARAETIPYLLKEWTARGVSNEDLMRMADRLKKGGRPDRAAPVLAALAERSPREESVKAGLLAFVDDPLTRLPAAAIIEKLLHEPRMAPGQLHVQNAAMRLASMWEQAGEYTRCLALLDQLWGSGVMHRSLSQQKVRVLCTLGRHWEALEEIEARRNLTIPGPGLAIPLAELYSGFGRDEESRETLEKELAGESPDLAAAQKFRELFPDENRGSGQEAAKAEDLLAGLNAGTASKAERFRAGRDLLGRSTGLSAEAQANELARLAKLCARDPGLLPEFYGLRKLLASKSGRMEEFERELIREWDRGRGPRVAAETLLLVYLEAKKFNAINGLLDESLVDWHFSEAAWDQAGLLLLAADQPELAARVLAALISRAPGNANRALFLAEALWKSGKKSEARELVFPIERIAALDLTRRPELARFELSVGNADAARRHLLALSDRPLDGATAALWSKLAAHFVTTKKLDDAHDAILRAQAFPSALTGDLIAGYHESRGELATLAPGTTAFRLPPALSREFQIESASRLAAADQTERAWLWLEAARRPLADSKGRMLALKLEKSDPARAAKLWEASLDAEATWDLRCDAARFFLRSGLAETNPALRLAGLLRAHDLHPGSFLIAEACAKELVREGKTSRAKAVFQDVVESFSESADRQAARKRLSEL